MGTFEVRTEKQEGGSTLQAGGMADGKGKRQKQVWHLLREKERAECSEHGGGGTNRMTCVGEFQGWPVHIGL